MRRTKTMMRACVERMWRCSSLLLVVAVAAGVVSAALVVAVSGDASTGGGRPGGRGGGAGEDAGLVSRTQLQRRVLVTGGVHGYATSYCLSSILNLTTNCVFKLCPEMQ